MREWDSDPQRRPPLFLSGARRSGTHLIYRLFDRHPDFFNPGLEVWFFEFLESLGPAEARHFERFLAEAPTAAVVDAMFERQLLPVLRNEHLFNDSMVNRETVDVAWDEPAFINHFDHLRCKAPADLRALFLAWFDAMRLTLEEEDRPRPVVWKTTDYGTTARAASRIFDDLRILFIVRHPFYSISSLVNLRRKQPHRFQFSPMRILEETAQINRMYECLKQLRTEKDVKVAVIRFEDLLHDSTKTLKPATSDLGIDWHDCLSEPTFFGRPWKGDSGFNIMHGVDRSPLDPNRILLSAEECAQVTECLEGFMQAFGYSGDIDNLCA
ncbi:sulfotransferase [Thalassospiraceae bacterium LMO-JJ14]|nr:sulfotransferase [Thalassospiraceae bacterium LMO-JJ14]